MYLDEKVYSHDETLTLLRTSGFLFSEFEQGVSERTRTVAQLQKFQHENADRTALATIRTLEIDDPQHPPLYYLLERSWDALFHGSIAGRRALGALFGVLTIPALYVLCRELLPRTSAFPLVAAALFAVSPFELEYTQQAREYTLWGLLTVIASTLFIRACRTNDRRIWLAYALVITAGLYAHPFFAFVIAAHAITLIHSIVTRRPANGRAFFLSIGAAAVAYAPWIYNLVQNRQTAADTNTWFGAAVPAGVYAYKWLFNVGAVFFDAEYTNLAYSIVLLPIAAVGVWSLYVVARSKDRFVALFVPALFFAAVLPLLVPDLILHQSRATAGRYLVPAWIAVNLAVAYWIAQGFETKGLRARIASVASVALIVFGLISWDVSARATSWYTASSDAPVLPIAKTIDEQPLAIILTDDAPIALQLSNYLRPKDRFVITNSALPTFLRDTTGVSRFLLEPSPALCAAISRTSHVNVQRAYEPPFTDSPMLHASFMDVPVLRPLFSSLRRKMTSIHGDNSGAFTLWSVTAAKGDRDKACH